MNGRGSNSVANQRQFERAPLSGGVKFFDWNEAHHAAAFEISGSGMFLRTAHCLPEGSMLTVRVALPGLTRAFTVLARVVRTVRGGLFTPAGMGVRFIDLAPGQRSHIVEYVHQRVLEPA